MAETSLVPSYVQNTMTIFKAVIHIRLVMTTIRTSIFNALINDFKTLSDLCKA